MTNTQTTQTTYEVRMDEADGERIEAGTLEEAMEKAEEWIKNGEWDASEGTVYLTGYLVEITLDEDGDEVEEDHEITVTVDPEEPKCTEAEHDWQAPHSLVGGIKENPGVWGHGGGVTMREACMHCGCGKFTDTWAQNPNNGEQGLTSVKYTSRQYVIPAEEVEEDEN